MVFDAAKFGDTLKSLTVDPELDKVKTALGEMREKTHGTDTAASMLDASLQALRNDLHELGVDPSQWPAYEEVYKTKFREATQGLEGEALANSFEATKLDTFIRGYASYAKLDEIIEQCRKKNSNAPMQGFLEGLRKNGPLLATLGASLLAWLTSDEKNSDQTKTKKPDTLVDKAAQADALMEEEEELPPSALKEEMELETDAIETVSGVRTSGRSSFDGRGPEGVSSSVKYDLDNPKYSQKMSPEEFRAAFISIKNPAAREALVLKQVAAGNAKIIFKDLPVTAPDGTKATLRVATKGLEVAGIPVQLSGPGAEAAMKLLGCTLPTEWLAEQRWKYARANNGVVPFIAAPQVAAAMGISWDPDHPDGNVMMSPEFALKRAEMLAQWKKDHGITDNQITDGGSKMVVHPVPGVTGPGRLAITGGRDINGTNIQGKPGKGKHEDGYYDYSHEALPVADGDKAVKVVKKGPDGKEVTTYMSATAFYADPDLAKSFGFKVKPVDHGYAIPQEVQTFVAQQKAPQTETPATAVASVEPQQTSDKKTS